MNEKKIAKKNVKAKGNMNVMGKKGKKSTNNSWHVYE